MILEDGETEPPEFLYLLAINDSPNNPSYRIDDLRAIASINIAGGKCMLSVVLRTLLVCDLQLFVVDDNPSC